MDPNAPDPNINTPKVTTKEYLLKRLEPYGLDEQIVFVTFVGPDIKVHERITVAKDHCTTRTNPDGTTSMPVAIYLVDEGKKGEPGVLGVKDPRDLLPDPDDPPELPTGEEN